MSYIITKLAEIWGLIASLLDALMKGGSTYGVVFGLIGLLIQLAVRGEWPTGRLNEGAPNTVDPSRLVMAVCSAIAAGVLATLVLKVGFPAAEACKDPGKYQDCLQGIKDPLALIAFGYVAADLGPPMLQKLAQLIGKIVEILKALPKWITGSR